MWRHVSMKINDMGNVINVVKQNARSEKKAELTSDQKQRIVDTITLENKQASTSQVQNVEDAKEMLTQVVQDMEGHTSNLHNINIQRVINLIQ